MKKIRNTIVVFILLAIVTPTSVLAWGELKRVEKHLDMGMFDNAHEILDEYIKKNPGDLNAHILLGRYYLLKNNYTAAIARFEAVLRDNNTLGPMVGKQFIKATEKAVAKGNISKAKTLYSHAVASDNKYAGNAGKFYSDLGKQAEAEKQYQLAEDCYDLSLEYAKDDLRNEIANRYMLLAAKGHNTENLKAKAIAIVGIERVREIFPEPKDVAIFKKIYDDGDIVPERGNIIAFVWSEKFRLNDTIEIIGNVPNGVNEIAIHRGKGFNPEWVTIKEGELKYPIKHLPPSGSYFVVWIDKGKGVTFTLRVIRKTKIEPKINLLVQK